VQSWNTPIKNMALLQPPKKNEAIIVPVPAYGLTWHKYIHDEANNVEWKIKYWHFL
jgi:hypothetical protein